MICWYNQNDGYYLILSTRTVYDSLSLFIIYIPFTERCTGKSRYITSYRSQCMISYLLSLVVGEVIDTALFAV